MSNITILSKEIRQNGDLYSLNDLHKASGEEQKHRPKYFLSNQQTKDLVAEISKGGIPPIQAKQGFGTYACRELVIAYAAWISPAFHLKVIRAFLDAHTPKQKQIGNGLKEAISEAVREAVIALPPTNRLPADQEKEIKDRLDRLGRMFHPFSDQFADVLGVMRALRGLHPRHGTRQHKYVQVIAPFEA